MRRVWIGILLALGLAGCDAGPSAVVHDGDGKAPATKAEKPPVWAEAKKTATDNSDIEEASMPVPGQMASSAQENDLQAKNLAAAKGFSALPVPKVKADITAKRYGEWPLWSSNRKYSADDNAHYHFEKHGADVGARSYDTYVAMVHGFIHNPPPGTQTLRRNNGDTLLYDPKGNVFAVMTVKGAPRTLFRPYEGAAYWQKQKQIEAGRRTIRDGGDE